MEHLEVGLYTARRIVTVIKSLEGEAAPPRQYQARANEVAHEAMMPPEHEIKKAKERPGSAIDDSPGEVQETRAMFRRKKKEEPMPARPVDRSNAVNVAYTPGADQYHGRKCLFHGEMAVSVCPNCGTLFCMECASHLDACPRCNIAINFIDQSTIPAAVDDHELIETESQRKAIQQRWAMKRLAEADMNSTVKQQEMHAIKPDREKMVEKLMRDTQKQYTAPLTQNAPKQAYRAATEKAAEPSLQDQIELLQQDAPQPQVYAPVEKAEAQPSRRQESVPVEEVYDSEPAPEEIPPEERVIPANKKTEDKKEKLRELLSQEEGPTEDSRDLSRL
jgi:hypothetical protein